MSDSGPIQVTDVSLRRPGGVTVRVTRTPRSVVTVTIMPRAGSAAQSGRAHTRSTVTVTGRGLEAWVPLVAAAAAGLAGHACDSELGM